MLEKLVDNASRRNQSYYLSEDGWLKEKKNRRKRRRGKQFTNEREADLYGTVNEDPWMFREPIKEQQPKKLRKVVLKLMLDRDFFLIPMEIDGIRQLLSIHMAI